MNKEYKYDNRKNNPSLHLLYVKWATKHLVLIDECINKLERCANTNLLDSIMALQINRRKLIKENAAYADAQEILDLIKEVEPTHEND